MSTLILGTFNLNNLFSRFDFKATLQDLRAKPARKLDEGAHWTRTFKGELIRAKPPLDREHLGRRILEESPDVLAVQEVEDRPTLDEFNAQELQGAYPYRVLVEGNDARLIDVGILSKRPIGEVRSYQHWRHPELPDQPIFRRDLLLAEILSPDRKQRAFWLAVTHLKSRFIDWRVKDPTERKAQEADATRLRRFEAQSIAAITSALWKQEPLFVCGDLNDTEDSEALSGLIGSGPKQLVNILREKEQDPEKRWTYTHDESGTPRQFEQLDFILTPKQHLGLVRDAWVQRRTKPLSVRDASDHDPVYVALKL